jgi:hypothetical protein
MEQASTKLVTCAGSMRLIESTVTGSNGYSSICSDALIELQPLLKKRKPFLLVQRNVAVSERTFTLAEFRLTSVLGLVCRPDSAIQQAQFPNQTPGVNPDVSHNQRPDLNLLVTQPDANADLSRRCGGDITEPNPSLAFSQNLDTCQPNRTAKSLRIVSRNLDTCHLKASLKPLRILSRTPVTSQPSPPLNPLQTLLKTPAETAAQDRSRISGSDKARNDSNGRLLQSGFEPNPDPNPSLTSLQIPSQSTGLDGLSDEFQVPSGDFSFSQSASNHPSQTLSHIQTESLASLRIFDPPLLDSSQTSSAYLPPKTVSLVTPTALIPKLDLKSGNQQRPGCLYGGLKRALGRDRKAGETESFFRGAEEEAVVGSASERGGRASNPGRLGLTGGGLERAYGVGSGTGSQEVEVAFGRNMGKPHDVRRSSADAQMSGLAGGCLGGQITGLESEKENWGHSVKGTAAFDGGKRPGGARPLADRFFPGNDGRVTSSAAARIRKRPMVVDGGPEKRPSTGETFGQGCSIVTSVQTSMLSPGVLTGVLPSSLRVNAPKVDEVRCGQNQHEWEKVGRGKDRQVEAAVVKPKKKVRYGDLLLGLLPVL